jgi:dTDP-4-dehydrorhamnose reductase
MRLAIAGAKGQLGTALVHECRSRHDDVTALDRGDLDVCSGRAVADMMERLRPDVIVNCTGYNTVDAAEDHPIDALALNAFAVRALARAANSVRATLVHYSTDFVFDGVATTPRSETDPPNPKSVYATSKLVGEWFAADVPRHYVLRVESLFGQAAGGPSPKGSVAAIIDALANDRVAKVLSDRVVSPTFIADAAFATRELLERNAAPGLYHCVNSGQATWLEFASEAARLLGVEPRFEILRFADVKLPAARPQYCALSNAKLAALGIQMPSWQDALGRYVKSIVASRSADL